MPTPYFKKGHKKLGGRKKGTPNKFTSLRDSFVSAFVRLGGEDAILEWLDPKRLVVKNGKGRIVRVLDLGGDRKKEFFRMIAQMLPRDVNVSGTMGVGSIKDFIESQSQSLSPGPSEKK